MPDYRNIHTEIWSDGWFELLPPYEKLVFIYLFSNSRSNLAGLYELSLRQAAFDTGVGEPLITDALEHFAEAGKAFYEDGVVWVPNMPQRNAFNIRSPKIQSNITRALIEFREHPLRTKAIEYWNKVTAPRYGIDTIPESYLHIISYHIISDHHRHAGADAGASQGAIPDVAKTEPEGKDAEWLTPLNFEEWLEALDKSTNPNATLRFMHETLFPGRDPPTYAFIGKTVRSVGGPGRLAMLYYIAAGHRCAGDPTTYCLGLHKRGGSSAKTGAGTRAPSAGETNATPADIDAIRRQIVEQGNALDAGIAPTGPSG